ncbi:serine/threonine protein kinase [Hyalangium minutum]|uniref:non-specific serine/threonine protein kinase n=1 Tax=Hyalangium minutum TaxID=394096 RepID=A0A085WNC0_9BACT|nr:serine/threonine-protein kinase [Hyalangium minutum]KFE69183.1 Serine/threonine protein kinase [Hyalangium minutum]
MTTLLRLPSGAMIDGWHVLRELGDGGSAVVYLVQKDEQLRALKVARHRDASGDAMQTHVRAMRELTVLLLLMEQGHPNIIQPLGYGYAEAGNMYIALEYVDGWTLGEWQEKKHPTLQEILRVFAKLASALKYMHSKGILHRDLKLSNVLIRKSDGEPVIIDFSCATHTQAADLTESGLPPGTDRFRAPEQFKFLREHRDEHRARYAFQVADELFAVGAMLYELLTDPRPTEARPRETLNSPFGPPSPARGLNARVPEALGDLVDDLLSRDPAKRPVDTDALHRELVELAAHPGAEYRVPAHPPSEQRRPEPVGEPVERNPGRWGRLRAFRQRAVAGARRSGKVLAAGTVTAVMLGALVTLWMRSGVPTLSSAAPPAPPQTAAPDMSPAPEPMPGRETAYVPQEEEGSPVKTQPPEDPKQARRQKTSPGSDLRKALTVGCAIAAGCTGAQVRPDPFTCPEGAVATRKQLGWRESEQFFLMMDDRYGEDDDVWHRVGDTVVGVVPKGVTGRQREVAPPGTRFFGGKVYVVPEKTLTGKPGSIIVKYDRVKLPQQEELPACFIVEMSSEELKDGAARTGNSTAGRPVDYWP